MGRTAGQDVAVASVTPLSSASFEPSASTVAVLLAAGAGSRFEGPAHKLTARLPNGRTLIEHTVATALAAAIGPVLVVVGAIDLDVPDGAEIVRNPRWAEGQASSLQAAVAEARRRAAAALVVGLADQPGIPAEAWRRVAASTSPIAVATYAGALRNPVRLHASVWPLLPTTGDHGARDLVRTRAGLVEQVPCPGSADDVDRLEDLTQLEQRWQSNSSTNSS